MRWWAAPATHAAFSSLCACLCCWLLVRVLPGLFGAGLRLCTTPARVRTLVIVSVCMAVGPLWLCSLGDSLRLWCWAGWSCRRKPHGKCLKYAQSMHFRALRAPWTKYITTSRGRGRKLHFSSGMRPKKISGDPDQKLSAWDALPCPSDTDAASFIRAALFSRRILMFKVRRHLKEVSL